MSKKLSIAVVGAGMGGLAAAATLRQAGIRRPGLRTGRPLCAHRRRHSDDAELDEGAARHRRRGSAARIAFAPYSHLNRDWDTGEVMRELPMPESLYGAPYLCMHRADLHEALASVVPAEIIHLNKKLVGLDQSGRHRSRCASPTATARRPMR